MFNPIRRCSFVPMACTAIVIVLAYGQIGCGGSSGSSANSGDAMFHVQTSNLFVTVENRAQKSFYDIKIAIVPVGRQTLYTTTIPRMDAGEKRDLALTSFAGRDGTPFTLRVARPKSVSVSAKDMNNQLVETEVPWQ